METFFEYDPAHDLGRAVQAVVIHDKFIPDVQPASVI